MEFPFATLEPRPAIPLTVELRLRRPNDVAAQRPLGNVSFDSQVDGASVTCGAADGRVRDCQICFSRRSRRQRESDGRIRPTHILRNAIPHRVAEFGRG